MKEEKLQFNEKKHEYKYKGKTLTSVTTFIKSFFNEFDVKKISKYVAKSRRNKGLKGASGKPVTAWDVRREWKDIAQEGTDIHEQIEEYIKTKGYSMNVEDVHPKARQGVYYYEEEMSKLNEPSSHTEFRLFSEKLGLAGTIDLMTTYLQDEATLKTNLYDWKTNKQLRTRGFKKSHHPLMKLEQDCNFIHYTLQLSLYAYILETEYKCNIGDLTIVHLDNERAVPYKVSYRKELIEEMLEYEE